MKDTFAKSASNGEGSQDVLVPSVRGKDGTGYDIFSQVLNETRTIMVQGQVEAAMAGVIIAQLKYLENLDEGKPIQMLINSPGGSVVDGLAIYDVMRQVKCPIVTIGAGMQASMGSIILAGGDTRIMTPNSQLLVHQGSGGGDGTPSDLEIGRAFHGSLIDKLTSIYQDQIGLTKEYWNIVLNRDTWFSAEQAKAIGFIHTISEIPENKKSPYAAESLSDAFNKGKEKGVAQFKTVADIRLALNDQNAFPGTDAARLRPELAVKLAQFPEFWTAGKKAEKALEAKSVVANDNSDSATPAAKRSRGPSPN